MPDYIEYTRGTVAYYIRPDLLPKISADGDLDLVRTTRVMQFADYAVDTSTNQFVKCRPPLTDVVRQAHAVTRYVRPTPEVVQSLTNLRDELVGRHSTGHLSQEAQVILMKINSCLYRGYPHD